MVTGVILAAGEARRMGQPKQLLTLGDKPMVWHVAATACQAHLDEVVVITGAYQAEVARALQDLPLRVVYNEDWAKGQATSVKKAVQSIRAKGQVVIFLLADQPIVDRTLINNLVQAFHKTNASIIIPCSEQRPGNPVLFDLSVWRSVLLQLSGDEGARQIIRQNQESVYYMEVPDEQPFADVDTPAEYELMEKLWQIVRKGSNSL